MAEKDRLEKKLQVMAEKLDLTEKQRETVHEAKISFYEKIAYADFWSRLRYLFTRNLY